MKILRQKFNFSQTGKIEKDGLVYCFARSEHCRALAELYSIATDGVADYYWSTVQKPGESMIDTGARLFSEDPIFNYKNCLVACDDKEVVGMSLQFHLEVDGKPALDPEAIDPVLLPYKKLEIIDSYHCAALAVKPEYKKIRVGVNLMTLAYECAIALGFKKLTHMVFAQKGANVMNFWTSHMGYTIAATEAVVENPFIKASGEVHLFVKDVSAACRA